MSAAARTCIHSSQSIGVVERASDRRGRPRCQVTALADLDVAYVSCTPSLRRLCATAPTPGDHARRAKGQQGKGREQHRH
jgi:hypothetical protein